MFAIRKDHLARAANSPIASGSRSSSPRQRNKEKGKGKANQPLARGRSLRSSRKYGKVTDCLNKPDVNMSAFRVSQRFIFIRDLLLAGDLRSLAWAGLPSELRPVAWPLLLGYLPLNQSSRLATLARKREEYSSLVNLTFASKGKEGLDPQIWHQIEIDVPRTRPGVKLWMEAGTQRVST